MTLYEVLQTELADPAYAGMTDAEAAAAINAKTITRKRAVETTSINAMADGMGLTPKVKVMLRKTNAEIAGIVGAENVDNFLGLCFAAVGLFEALYKTVDFTDQKYEAAYKRVADGLKTFGLLSDEEHATFLAVGSETVNWLSTVTPYDSICADDVTRARTN
jgi:hypothetical protein